MNREQQRFQAAVAAMQSLMRHEGYIYVHWKNLAKYSVEIADYLLADLDATAASNVPETPKADADGWIPHRPGDPMPCHEKTMCRRKYRNGKIGIRGIANDYSWGEWGGGETEIIAWKPA